MVLNFNMPAKKPRSNKLNPGSYQSVIKAVKPAPDYADGEAVQIEYELRDKSGNVRPYKEIFFTASYNERTAAFLQYLEDAGITNLYDIVGRQEDVLLQKQVRNNHTFVNITRRSFVTDAQGNEDDGLGDS